MMKTKLPIMLSIVALAVICVVFATPIITGGDEDEKEVTLDQVPPAVKATILKEAGDHKITELEEISKDGKVVCYDAEWKVDGKEVAIEVAPDGTLLNKGVEDDDDDDEDDDD